MRDRSSMRLADRLERGDVLNAACPSRAILNQVTSKWGVLALIALGAGTLRFSALRRKVGVVSERMLSQTLQQLEASRLVHRHSYREVPPRVEYSLTPLGIEAAERVEALADWIELHLPQLIGKTVVDEMADALEEAG